MTELSRARLPTLPFGRTGHESSRLLFGAAALSRVSQDEADRALAQIQAAGVDHIDVAVSYGYAELRLAPFLRRHRRDVLLATRTGERSHAAAREQIRRSLERPGVCVDTAGDVRLLEPMLRAGASFAVRDPAARAAADPDPAWAQRTEPLFVRGFAPSA